MNVKKGLLFKCKMCDKGGRDTFSEAPDSDNISVNHKKKNGSNVVEGGFAFVCRPVMVLRGGIMM